MVTRNNGSGDSASDEAISWVKVIIFKSSYLLYYLFISTVAFIL